MGLTLQAILREHYDRFAASHPLAAYQRRAARRMRDCRTAALGGHWRSCPNGHVHTVHYNSCHHRSCPLCAGVERERWLAGWKARLLDCPHVHVVFTTPHELIPLWRYNKAAFARLLFHAATGTLSELLSDAEYLGGRPGMLAGLHTWNQQLLAHVHLHVLVTWGGLDALGQWVRPTRDCLLPRKVLMYKFRGKFLAFLKAALDRGKLVLPPDTSLPAARGLLNKLGRVDWNVKLLDRYKHGRGVLTYLARYLKGGPIRHGRLLDCREGMVRFTYRDNGEPDPNDGRARQKTCPLRVDQFLARWLEHVPPPHLQTVRGYGLYANSKVAALEQARSHFGQPQRAEPEKTNWRDLCVRAGNPAAAVCPVCGAELVVHSRFPPGRVPTLSAQPPPGKVA
jgi:hypothetical protein